MDKVRFSMITAVVALLGALSMNSQAATLSYTGEVSEATGAFAGLTPIGTAVGGVIEVTDASFLAGLSGPGDITDIGVAVGGFCFAFGGGTCPGALVPITSIDSAALTYASAPDVSGSFTVTAFSPTFNVSIPIAFDLTAGTFAADGGFLGLVSGPGDATVAPVPVPAAALLFGSALLGLIGLGRRRATA